MMTNYREMREEMYELARAVAEAFADGLAVRGGADGEGVRGAGRGGVGVGGEGRHEAGGAH